MENIYSARAIMMPGPGEKLHAIYGDIRELDNALKRHAERTANHLPVGGCNYIPSTADAQNGRCR